MMTDLFSQAMAWLKDRGLPEPESIKLVHTDYLHRVELTYLCPASDLPDLGWSVSRTGAHEFVEIVAGDVLVSIYAERSKVTA